MRGRRGTLLHVLQADGSKYGMWPRSWGERNGSYRGKDTTKYEAETMDVSLMVGVVLHGGWRGGFGDVVGLGGSNER